MALSLKLIRTHWQNPDFASHWKHLAKFQAHWSTTFILWVKDLDLPFHLHFSGDTWNHPLTCVEYQFHTFIIDTLFILNLSTQTWLVGHCLISRLETKWINRMFQCRRDQHPYKSLIALLQHMASRTGIHLGEYNWEKGFSFLCCTQAYLTLIKFYEVGMSSQGGLIHCHKTTQVPDWAVKLAAEL